MHPDLVGQPWAAALKAHGHIVWSEGIGERAKELLWDVDLILAPQAARFLPGMEKFLEDFIKGARKVKYPKEPR